MPAINVVDALRAVTLFRDLDSSDVDALARQVVQRRYGRNEVIFPQADRGDGLYIVASGHVSISRQNPDGDELVFGLYESGEYFGELALFDDEPRAAGATSVDESILLFLSRNNFRSFIDSHPRALWTCLQVVVAQLRRCTDIADEIALLDVRTRLARRLLRLAGDGTVVSGTTSAGREETFRLTQQLLANMTGATRESVNKHLNSFVDEGLILLDHGHISILDSKRLERLSNGLP